ncbi:unnamed protein product [Diabrotica balteata]|uniref:Uncharacterized protein n=1 Tax=Diabrotica balteata TaxID=107213 RepID=A0A9N9SZS7_DIABA|nr:unnamed protein product [Diabrotica balteata]
MSCTNSLKKIVLITGANKGLGFEIALKLSQKNFKVIMADKDKQSESRNKIICMSGNEDVYDYFLDLSSFESVRCFSKKLLEKVSYVDVLVNNAGIFCMKKCRTIDCLDGVMQVNHLGPFLLTHLMVDMLKTSQNPRIIFVTSNGSFFHNLTVEKLKTPDYFTPHFISGAIHYYNTKLCNMIASKGFAEKLRKSNIMSNCVHPRMMNTTLLTASHKGKGDFLSNMEESVAKFIVKSVTRDASQCVNAVAFLAYSDKVKNVSGRYFCNYQVHREPKVLEDKQFCDAIWKESEKLVGL